ncbi:transcriptional regulator, AraC family [Candidatus Moduliflexus flocculans]|uniref:Transcriptional regulator, AraC family n=1 Tax=Candidatus Moduliflexus flocculans TaxID=1499966 RepID=A0A081BP23_9BACT|nr:transcriptional regulator, AraC family [Candidatus Moduliflexus flocculans]
MMKEKPQIRFDRFPEIFDCQLAHGMNVTHHFPRHIHQTLIFGMIERGTRRFEIAGQILTANAGDCFVIHPGEAHSCRADAPHDYRALSLSFAAIRSILNLQDKRPDMSPHFAPPVFRDEAFAQMFLRFSNEAKRSDDWFRSQTLLIELLDYALAHFSDSPEQSSFSNALHSEVRRIRQYLEAHFDAPIRLDTLAEVAGLSPYYLNRIFQAEVGVPPYEYLVKIRLKHAQEMLSNGHSIAEAAHHSGFADQSHLTRFFKKHVGMTPGAYRQTHAART